MWNEIIDILKQIFIPTPPKIKPVLHPIVITSAQVAAELAVLETPIVGVQLDERYAYLSADEWQEAIQYLLFVFPWPKYVPDFMDCDKFAMLMKALMSAVFNVNCISITIGFIPGGHAWNMLRDEQGWLELEPQNQEIFALGDRNYAPKMVII